MALVPGATQRAPRSVALAAAEQSPPPSDTRSAPPAMSTEERSFDPSCFVLRAWISSRNHAALEHLVGDRRRDLVDEGGPCLRVAAQQLDQLLLALRLRLAPRLPQLLARGLVVLLDHAVRHHVEDRK